MTLFQLNDANKKVGLEINAEKASVRSCLLTRMLDEIII